MPQRTTAEVGVGNSDELGRLKDLISARHNNRSPYKANRRNNQATDRQSRRANRDANDFAPQLKREYPKRRRHTDRYQQPYQSKRGE
jgi:hypothetical protein